MQGVTANTYDRAVSFEELERLRKQMMLGVKVMPRNITHDAQYIRQPPCIWAHRVDQSVPGLYLACGRTACTITKCRCGHPSLLFKAPHRSSFTAPAAAIFTWIQYQTVDQAGKMAWPVSACAASVSRAFACERSGFFDCHQWLALTPILSGFLAGCCSNTHG
jgi:hypothetical protein